MKQWIVTTEEVRRYRVEYFVKAKTKEIAKEKCFGSDERTEELISTVSVRIESVQENK